MVVSVFDLSKLTFTGRKPDVMTRGGVGFVLNVIRRGWMHPRVGVALWGNSSTTLMGRAYRGTKRVGFPIGSASYAAIFQPEIGSHVHRAMHTHTGTHARLHARMCQPAAHGDTVPITSLCGQLADAFRKSQYTIQWIGMNEIRCWNAESSLLPNYTREAVRDVVFSASWTLIATPFILRE